MEGRAGAVPAAGRMACVPSPDADLLALLGTELGRLQRFALLLTGDPNAAEELVADAIAQTLPRWRAGRVHDGAAYLRRVMANQAARRWRRSRLGRDRDHHALGWTTTAPNIETDAVERDRAVRAVLLLPPRRRAIVVLRFYDDLPEARIADVLGIGVGTVKSQLSRALAQLRVTLDDREEP
jgi:RNA polymerase sigma-70 factor (sigma-E family)